MMKTTSKLLSPAVFAIVLAATFMAVSAAVDVSVEEGDRDTSGPPTVHNADEAPQVVRNKLLAEPCSLVTERAGFAIRPSPSLCSITF